MERTVNKFECFGPKSQMLSINYVLLIAAAATAAVTNVTNATGSAATADAR